MLSPGGAVVGEGDEALVRRAKDGDFEAFEELVRRHERRLYALARSIVRSAEDAEDVVQTAFLTALERLGDLRDEVSFGPWVRR
ncbi:MAG: RNA polymerase subunit sigma-24, partial [bacterium]|nr:RNA polymerase subunit sigma-24 [bacterium]